MRIEIQKTWRFKGALVHTGIYRVPQDITEDMASKAIEELHAVEIAPPSPKAKVEKPGKNKPGKPGKQPDVVKPQTPPAEAPTIQTPPADALASDK